jgi:Flp pilus assembly protein CpaB
VVPPVTRIGRGQLKRSNRLFMLVGIILAGVAFVLVMLMMGRPSQPSGQPQTGGGDLNVVAAKTDVQLGEALTADNLTTKKISGADPLAVTAYRDVKQVEGLVVRRPVTAGQIITPADFGQRVTAANVDVVRSLEKGLRAIAVQVDQVTGVGTLIQPGDRVDVILAVSDTDAKFPETFDKRRPEQNEIDVGLVPNEFFNGTTIKVVVQNSQVLGTLLPPPETVDGQQQNTPPEETTPGNEQGTALTGQKMIVILAVTAQQAEIIRFTQLDGNLSLVLRAPEDKATAPDATSGITLAKLMTDHGVLKPELTRVILPAK